MSNIGDAEVLEVLRRQIGRTVSSISFSRNAASYFPRPRLRSQTTMSMTAPYNRGGAIICLGSEGVQGGGGFLRVRASKPRCVPWELFARWRLA